MKFPRAAAFYAELGSFWIIKLAFWAFHLFSPQRLELRFLKERTQVRIIFIGTKLRQNRQLTLDMQIRGSVGEVILPVFG